MIFAPRKRLTATKVLICLSINPYRHLVRRWNWKSALLSAFFRGILIFLANLSAGASNAAGAMLAEICYRGLTTGFYSALIQAFRFAHPVWAASVVPMILIPILSDTCEFAMHSMRGTQRLGATLAASMLFTAISTFFELFAMRHGAFVMGESSKPLLDDLRELPRLMIKAATDVISRYHSASPMTPERRANEPATLHILQASELEDTGIRNS